MKIDELIEQLESISTYLYAEDERVILKAAETIRLLLEIARETNIEKYKRQIDEMEGKA